mgnify:FL=1
MKKLILILPILLSAGTSCAMIPNKFNTCPIQGPRISIYDELVHDSAREFKLDPALVFSVIETGSGFNPQAKSRAGAKGLMQLMGPTARKMGVRDPFHPAQNIYGGTRYLRMLYDKYDGNLALTLASYNAGPGTVKQHRGVPPAARKFVRKVLRLQDKYTKQMR